MATSHAPRRRPCARAALVHALPARGPARPTAPSRKRRPLHAAHALSTSDLTQRPSDLARVFLPVLARASATQTLPCSPLDSAGGSRIQVAESREKRHERQRTTVQLPLFGESRNPRRSALLAAARQAHHPEEVGPPRRLFRRLSRLLEGRLASLQPDRATGAPSSPCGRSAGATRRPCGCASTARSSTPRTRPWRRSPSSPGARAGRAGRARHWPPSGSTCPATAPWCPPPCAPSRAAPGGRGPQPLRAARRRPRVLGGKLKVGITWGKAGPVPAPPHPALDPAARQLLLEDDLIRIHRVLDQPRVPRYVVEAVVSRELLRAAIPPVVRDGERRVTPRSSAAASACSASSAAPRPGWSAT